MNRRDSYGNDQKKRFPGFGKYRIVQRGIHAFMIQRKILWFWIDALEYDTYSEERAHEVLNQWADDAAVYGKVVWPL